MMNQLNLGFLTIVREGQGYAGGYLVTNMWGRPLEFRLSSTVEPGRMHQIAYGATLQPYICADLIGKALVEKATTPVHLLLTDHELTLDLRHRLAMPVLWLAAAGSPRPYDAVLQPGDNNKPSLVRHHRYPEDEPPIRDMLDKLDPAFNLLEPFDRIHEAMAEAGGSVTARAA
jgi:hypothetical protein